MLAVAPFQPVPNKPVYEPKTTAALMQTHFDGIIAKLGSGAIVTCNGANPGPMTLVRTPDGIELRCEGSSLGCWTIALQPQVRDRPFTITGVNVPSQGTDTPAAFAQMAMEYVLKRYHAGGIRPAIIRLPLGELAQPTSSPVGRINQ